MLMNIISQILKIANGGGVTGTMIMYKGLLSYAQSKGKKKSDRELHISPTLFWLLLAAFKNSI